MEEEQLIAGLRAKDRKTIEYLYDKYSRALFAVISRIIIDKEIAEEVFHDAFIKITGKMDSYDSSKGRLYTWMADIYRDSAIDKTRSKEFSKGSKTNMQQVAAAGAFAITIEPKGGSESPTLENLVVLGEVA